MPHSWCLYSIIVVIMHCNRMYALQLLAAHKCHSAVIALAVDQVGSLTAISKEDSPPPKDAKYCIEWCNVSPDK